MKTEELKNLGCAFSNEESLLIKEDLHRSCWALDNNDEYLRKPWGEWDRLATETKAHVLTLIKIVDTQEQSGSWSFPHSHFYSYSPFALSVGWYYQRNWQLLYRKILAFSAMPPSVEIFFANEANRRNNHFDRDLLATLLIENFFFESESLNKLIEKGKILSKENRASVCRLENFLDQPMIYKWLAPILSWEIIFSRMSKHRDVISSDEFARLIPKILKVFIENGPVLSPKEKWIMFFRSLSSRYFKVGLNEIEKLLPVDAKTKFEALKDHAAKAAPYTTVVADYLLETKSLVHASIEDLFKILESHRKTGYDYYDSHDHDKHKEICKAIVIFISDNYNPSDIPFQYIERLHVLTQEKSSHLVQAILENPILPKLISPDHLCAIALEDPEVAKWIIHNPGSQQQLRDEQIFEIAKIHPALRQKILELGETGEVKLTPKFFQFVFNAQENSNEVKRLLLQNTKAPVDLWLQLFEASDEEMQKAVAAKWIKLPNVDRLLLLEKFYNYDPFIKGKIFFNLCSQHRFLTWWIPAGKEGATVNFPVEWWDKLLLMKVGYQDTQVEDKDQIRRADIAQLFNKLHGFGNDLYKSDLTTSYATSATSWAQSLFSRSRPPALLELKEESTCPIDGDIKGLGVKNIGFLAFGKQKALKEVHEFDFIGDPHSLTIKGELQVCAYILTLMKELGKQKVQDRFDIAARYQRFASLREKLKPIVKFWGENEHKLTATSGSQLSIGVQIVIAYYASLGTILDDSLTAYASSGTVLNDSLTRPGAASELALPSNPFNPDYNSDIDDSQEVHEPKSSVLTTDSTEQKRIQPIPTVSGATLNDSLTETKVESGFAPPPRNPELPAELEDLPPPFNPEYQKSCVDESQEVHEPEPSVLTTSFTERKRIPLTPKVIADDDWPPSMCCPITGELMKDPVTVDSGHSFEREEIEKWFEKHNTNPVTNLELPNKTLKPNFALKASIEELRQMLHKLASSDASLPKSKGIGENSRSFMPPKKVNEKKPKDAIKKIVPAATLKI